MSVSDFKPVFAEIVKEVRQQDIRRMQELLLEAFEDSNTDVYPDRLSVTLGQVVESPSADWIVSRNQVGEVVSTLFVNSIAQAIGPTVRIDDVATDKRYRRRGHAAATVAKAIEWADEREAELISLGSEEQMLPAHALYNSMGFQTNTNLSFVRFSDKSRV